MLSIVFLTKSQEIQEVSVLRTHPLLHRRAGSAKWLLSLAHPVYPFGMLAAAFRATSKLTTILGSTNTYESRGVNRDVCHHQGCWALWESLGSPSTSPAEARNGNSGPHGAAVMVTQARASLKSRSQHKGGHWQHHRGYTTCMAEACLHGPHQTQLK